MKPLTLTTSLALASALLTLTCTAVFAQEAVKEIGAPLTPPTAMGTYGLDTPSRAGLKALTPQGWQLLVHKKVVLPATVSWSADQTWLQAIGSVAQKAGATALVDWATQTVYLQPGPGPEAHAPEALRNPAAAPEAAAPLLAEAPSAAVSAAGAALSVRTVPPKANEALAAQPQSSGNGRSSEAAAAPAASASAPSDKADFQGRVAQAERELAAARVAAHRSARSASERLDPRLEYTEDSKGQVVPAEPRQLPARPAAQKGAEAVPGPAHGPLPVERSRANSVATPSVAAEGSPSVGSSAPSVAFSTSPGQSPLSALAPLSSAVALNRQGHRQAAEQLATLHGAYLDYRFPGDVRMPGPVTLIGADLGEDVRLLQQAMGPASPVVLEYCRQPAFVRAVPAGAFSSGAEVTVCQEAVARPRPEKALAQAVEPPPAQTLRRPATAVVSAPETVTSATSARAETHPRPAASEAGLVARSTTLRVLRVDPGQDLEDSLRSFLAVEGMRLSWESSSSFAPTELAWERSGADVVEVLRKLLPALGLEAEVNLNDKTVRVTDKANRVRG